MQHLRRLRLIKEQAARELVCWADRPRAGLYFPYHFLRETGKRFDGEAIPTADVQFLTANSPSVLAPRFYTAVQRLWEFESSEFAYWIAHFCFQYSFRENKAERRRGGKAAQAERRFIR